MQLLALRIIGMRDAGKLNVLKYFPISGYEVVPANRRKVMLGRRFGYVAGGWIVFALAIFGVALIVSVTPAQAVTFDLTSCHVDGGCGTQTSFGTVTLTQNGANVDFVVSLAGTNRFVQTGAADQQLFKFNGASGVGNIINEATANPLNAVPGGLQGFAGAFN